MVPWSSPEYDVPGNSHCHCQMSGNQKFKFVRSVVDGLDNNARAIIKSIGFGGFLMFPNLSDDNTRFGMWLMSKFDQERNAITVEGKPPMQLSIQLVRDIFGVPEEDLDVRGNKEVCEKKIVDVISRYLRRGDDGCIVEDAFRVLGHKWNPGDTLAVDATRVATVILL